MKNFNDELSGMIRSDILVGHHTRRKKNETFLEIKRYINSRKD